MPFFCISVNPRLPVVVAAIHKKRPHGADRDGFSARYIAQLDANGVRGAELVIAQLDDLMGSKTKAPGTYQSSYQEVRELFDAIMQDAPKPEPRPVWLRWLALLTALALAAIMAVTIPWAVLFWLFWSAIRSVNGLVLAAETEVLFSILDWRPTITRLIAYWRFK
jgi:hypothetical protein